MNTSLNATATAAGVLVFATVFTLAVMARRPVPRQPARAQPSDERSARRWLRWVVRSVIVMAGLIAAGPFGAAIAALVVWMVPTHRRRSAERRRRHQIDQAMPDAIELFVLCVHAGQSPVQTIEELARAAPPPTRPAFAAVALQLHRGRTLADALAELPRLAGAAGRELASAVATADRDGLPLAPVLDRLATEARANRRRAGDAAARRLPVQLSFPLVMCTLPSFVLLAIAPAVLGALSTLRDRAP